MSIGSPDLINSVFRKMEDSERNAFPENNKSFEDRIKLSEKNINSILESSFMVEIAKGILINNPEINIDTCLEADIEPLCQNYDPAVIISICRKIRDNIKKSN